MKIKNISQTARGILLKKGISEVEKVVSFSPRTLNSWGVPFKDLLSLKRQLLKNVNRNLLSTSGWSGKEFRNFRSEKKGFYVNVEGGIIQRLVHRASGKHYKKPRYKKAIF